MTALAIDLLQQVSEAGGTVRLEGDMLRLSAPEPLPDDLRARLRQHKAEIVALLSAAEPADDAAPDRRDHGWPDLPAEVADGVRAILAADGAQGVPPNRWPQIQRDTRGWSNADGCMRRSTSAGARPICSAATSGHPGTGSTARARPADSAAMRSSSSPQTWRRSGHERLSAASPAPAAGKAAPGSPVGGLTSRAHRRAGPG